MKKPIQITEKNAAAIEAALAEVNGRAEAHTYTSFSEMRAALEVIAEGNTDPDRMVQLAQGVLAPITEG